MSLVALAAVLAADPTPDPSDVKPGWLGFGVFLVLAVAVVLLWLSMRRHLRKVDFEEAPADRAADDASRDVPGPLDDEDAERRD